MLVVVLKPATAPVELELPDELHAATVTTASVAAASAVAAETNGRTVMAVEGTVRGPGLSPSYLQPGSTSRIGVGCELEPVVERRQGLTEAERAFDQPVGEPRILWQQRPV